MNNRLTDRAKRMTYRMPDGWTSAGYDLRDYQDLPPYKCCAGHPPIGYWVEEGELCPVCSLNNRINALEEAKNEHDKLCKGENNL